jgi:hypothetical protein
MKGSGFRDDDIFTQRALINPGTEVAVLVPDRELEVQQDAAFSRALFAVLATRGVV